MSDSELDRTYKDIRSRINSELDLKALEMARVEIEKKRKSIFERPIFTVFFTLIFSQVTTMLNSMMDQRKTIIGDG